MMIDLTPAISSYLNSLLGRLELYRKTDIPELDLKQQNGLHSLRSKVKGLVEREVPLATACPLTDTLMKIWVERQLKLASEVLNTFEEPLCLAPVEDDSAEKLKAAEEAAFYKMLNDQSTTEKLKDVRDLFQLVNEICLTLKEQQTELRKLRTQGRLTGSENTFVTNLRQAAAEDLSGPSMSGRVWVDMVISQLNTDFDVPVSPLLTATGPEAAATAKAAAAPVDTAGATMYENVVSFEPPQDDDHLLPPALQLEDDLFANPSVMRPAARRPRVKFNTRKELQEHALLGLCCDEPSPAAAPPPPSCVESKLVTVRRRRMSINTKVQSQMEEISDELKGLTDWKR